MINHVMISHKNRLVKIVLLNEGQTVCFNEKKIRKIIPVGAQKNQTDKKIGIILIK